MWMKKIPLRAAMAARLLNKSSKIRVFHLGKAHNDTWAIAAKKEQMENPRYHWLGEVTARSSSSRIYKDSFNGSVV